MTLWSSVIARAAASAVDLWADVLAVYSNTDDEEKELVFEAVVETAMGIAEEYDACCGCQEDVIDVEYAVHDAITAAGF